MKDGGPAFPRNQAAGSPHEPGGEVWLMQRGMLQEGMSLRDYFAGQALAGIVQFDAKLLVRSVARWRRWRIPWLTPCWPNAPRREQA